MPRKKLSARPKRKMRKRGGKVTIVKSFNSDNKTGVTNKNDAHATYMRTYDAMVRDPAYGPMVRAPYLGTESGYLVKQVDLNTPSISIGTATAGSAISLDACLVYTPAWLSNTGGTGYLFGGAPSGTTSNTFGSFGNSTFVTNVGIVKRFRPVACMMKWIPLSPALTKAGIVSVGYSEGPIVASGAGFSANAVLSLALNYCANGTREHVIRWLPTASDQQFISQGTNPDGAGSIFVNLKAVDGIVNTGGTTAALSGVFEVTTVFEWLPIVGEGLSIVPTAPPPFTINDHQSTITDLGRYLVDGVNSRIAAASSGPEASAQYRALTANPLRSRMRQNMRTYA